MIITFLLYIAAFVMNLLLLPLEAVSNVLSAIPQLEEAIIWLLRSLMYFSGIINIPALFAAINFVIGFFVTMFTFKIIFWLLKLIPGFGKINNPFSRSGEDTFAERQGYYPEKGGKPYTINVDASKWYKRK